MDCSSPDSSAHGTFQARILLQGIFHTQASNLSCIGKQIPYCWASRPARLFLQPAYFLSPCQKHIGQGLEEFPCTYFPLTCAQSKSQRKQTPYSQRGKSSWFLTGSPILQKAWNIQAIFQHPLHHSQLLEVLFGESISCENVIKRLQVDGMDG